MLNIKKVLFAPSTLTFLYYTFHHRPTAQKGNIVTPSILNMY